LDVANLGRTVRSPSFTCSSTMPTASHPVVGGQMNRKEVHDIDISEAGPQITNVFDVRLEPI